MANSLTSRKATMKNTTKDSLTVRFTTGLVIFLFSINTTYAEYEFEKITLVSGEILENVKILEVSYAKVRLRHADGIISVDPSKLPDEIRQKIGVSKEVIAKKLAEDQLDINNRKEFLKFKDQALVLISGEVLQVLDEGSLLVSKARFKRAKEVPHDEKWIMEDTIILHLDGKHGLVSGDSLRPHSNWALHTGEFNYTTVLGSSRTARRYEMRSGIILKTGLGLTKLDPEVFKKLAGEALPLVQ